jgi:DNA-binding FrmR family transcriptional regulator
MQVRAPHSRIEEGHLRVTLEEERGCSDVLQQITSCRGAMNGLLAVVLEDHIRTHLVDADTNDEPAGSATDQLIEVVHSYFK